jgi:hypothetical protein
MFTWPRRRRSVGDRNSALIRTVAERSAAELIERIDARPPMDVAELRGYVRARAGVCVRRQVQHAMGRNDAHESLSTESLSAAIERVVHLVVREQLLRSQLPVVRRAAA